MQEACAWKDRAIYNPAGHYLQSLELYTEAAAAYKAAAGACSEHIASSGTRRAAELYRGLALVGVATPEALETAYGILSSSADPAEESSMPIM